MDLRLVRYKLDGAPRGSILLVHGLASGCSVFTAEDIKVNLATYLRRNGYDVWLLDYRLSALLPDHERGGWLASRQWTMDQIAHNDMAGAVRHIYDKTCGPIQVFAHCVGAGCMAMAILSGDCHDHAYVDEKGRRTGRPMTKALALHAVHPWVVPSTVNHVKDNLAAFLGDAITVKTLDAALPDVNSVTASEVLLDRIAGSIPAAPRKAWWTPWKKTLWEAWWEGCRHRFQTDEARVGRHVCDRMTLFYGWEWLHSDLTSETHRKLVNLVGIANLETFRQIYFILLRRRLTTREGENTYVLKENFDKFWTFPTLFAHGRDNQLYRPDSAVASYLRLRELRPTNGPNGRRKVDVYWFEASDCGHFDFLFGKNGYWNVYPYLDAFFRRAKGAPLDELQEVAKKLDDIPPPERDPFWERNSRPEYGPIIGWVDNGGKKRITFRLWVEPIRYSAIPPTGEVVLPTPPHVQVSPPLWLKETDYPGTYWIYDVSVPRGFGKYLRISVDYADPTKIRFKLETLETVSYNDFKQALKEGRVEEVSLSAEMIQGRIRATASDEAQGTVPTLVVFDTVVGDDPDLVKERQAQKEDLIKELQTKNVRVTEEIGVTIPLTRLPWFEHLACEKDPNYVAFLVGSCRYSGSPFDEDLADRIFLAMREHVGTSSVGPGVDHVLLVGDQIYADATADIFETRNLRERFAQPYREAFGAPNLRRLLASVPTYMALDDHEFDDNWPGDSGTLDPNDPIVRRSRENFRHGLAGAEAYQWSMSRRDGWPGPPWIPQPNDRGLWHTFESGGLPFFVMDTRTVRRLREASVTRTASQIVGPRQLKALTDWLDKHKEEDKPKFIVSGSVLAPVARDFTRFPDLYRSNDGWAGYPATWQALVRYIVAKQIQKVVFIAGDYHLSALAKLTLSSNSSGKAPVTAYQIMASALFAPLPFANAHPRDYEWGRPPQALPFSDPVGAPAATRLEFEPYLLSTNRSHFLRVDVQPAPASAGSPPWEIRVSVCDHSGIIEPVQRPAFAMVTNNVVQWTL